MTEPTVPSKIKINKVALVGNPNSGKTSLFNLLTGLNQKVGNYPGITIDKKSGYTSLPGGKRIEITDLPGSYSLNARSEDEKIVSNILSDKNNETYPDLVIVTADMANLERNMLLFTQVYDRNLPVILVLTMPDVAKREGFGINPVKLQELLGNTPVVIINNRSGSGIDALKKTIENYNSVPYIPFLTEQTENFNQEIEARFRHIRRIVSFARESHKVARRTSSSTTRNLDKILTHKFWGFMIFILVLGIIFQAIFSLASYPMDLIDQGFGSLSNFLAENLPEGAFSDLIANGITPGLGGIVIFIPQIAILFGFLAFLEETGYMARVVFIMDKIMRKFGLNGRSVVPLISGMACAIPAIMATRSIDDWKERLITILVTPFMSCSARLPVYTLMISLILPPTYLLGFINVQGLALLAMYLLGLFAALLGAIILKKGLKMASRGFLLMELPLYKWPRWGNIGLTMWQKSGTFVWEAGRIILAISIILWVLASYGPQPEESGFSKVLGEAQTLETSYVGYFGKGLEPAIKPLGYDWKIGIALITSFAAREVFVGTIATIYSVNAEASEPTIINRLRKERHPDGSLVFTVPTAISILLFYAFAMQCMSTIAVVYRETKTWKWPLIQAVGMTLLAYVSSFVVYQMMTL